MASRPNTDIGLALSQPANVWRLFYAAKRAAMTSTDPNTREMLNGLLCELEFGQREHADEMSDGEAEAGIAAHTWSHDIAGMEVAK